MKSIVPSRSATRSKHSWRVRPGVLLVRARLRRPASALIKLDLPTFDLPANASSANTGAGSSRTSLAAITNSAFLIVGVSALTLACLARDDRDDVVELADAEQVAHREVD